MISEILDREFVLTQARLIQKHLSGPSTSSRRRSSPMDAVGAIDKEAAELLDSAIQREDAARSTVRRGGSSNRSAKGSPNEPYISSDPIISIVQSSLEEYLRDPTSPDQGKVVRRAGDEPFVTDSEVVGERSSRGRRIFEKFSVTDIGWVSSLVAMGIRKFESPHPFNPEPAPTHILSDRFRLIVVGDWGSGVPRAQKTATSMRNHLKSAMDAGLECHVVHLGDVYYSGFEYEYRDRFLAYWPVYPDEASLAGSWCLNGNHDMYSGGHAYFDYLLKDPRFARQAGSSFFCLANKHWQILGLDTAWDDDGLKDPQASWVKKRVSDNDSKTMILTHHQLFSAREHSADVGKVLREKLGSVLDAGKIDAAIWGHEHRCVLYEPYGNVKYARLIGHGGVPVWADDSDSALPKPGMFQSTEFMTSILGEKFAYMGYAVLDFDQSKIVANYFDENGKLETSEIIS
ncbi:hypothetical protein HFO86_15075 [Rhizobium leguminosarum]|uniref:metallophosphoesterase family protein n=1 Tax=Rhizobium leguminosarum TaxID=384 RepID=UPI001C958D88|nr:metallophosphoesterase [Rhizobium leguminosarum]MBY5471521.1 hypothetical protein [Rhizobium leguminosarum]